MERRIFFFLLEAEDEFLVQVDSIEKRKKEISCEIFDSFKLKQIQWIIRGGDGLTFVQGDSSFSFSLTALSLSLSLPPFLSLCWTKKKYFFVQIGRDAPCIADSNFDSIFYRMFDFIFFGAMIP